MTLLTKERDKIAEHIKSIDIDQWDVETSRDGIDGKRNPFYVTKSENISPLGSI